MSVPAYVKHIGLIILFVVATVNFTKTTLSVIESSKRLDTARTEVSALEEEKASLESELEYRNSIEYVQEEARNKLGLVMPGEEIFVVSQVLGDFSRNVVGTENSVTSKSNVQLWFDLFF